MTLKKDKDTMVSFSYFVVIVCFTAVFLFLIFKNETKVPKAITNNEALAVFPFLPSTYLRKSGFGVCTHTSPWVHRRGLESSEPECKEWLSTEALSRPPPDTFVSQAGQDVFLFYNFFRCMDGPGTYLDIGAGDPKGISNTWFLDKCLGWKGICADGNKLNAEKLTSGRSCHVIDKVISNKAGNVKFSNPGGFAGTVSEVPDTNVEALTRTETGTDMQTITLASALDEVNWGRVAPGQRTIIDFLSLDVEYHELEVLTAVPWERVDIRFASIENNNNFLDNWEYLMRHGFFKAATLSLDDIFMRVEGANALWLPGNIDQVRIRDSAARRDGNGALLYLHKSLYTQGWEAYLRNLPK